MTVYTPKTAMVIAAHPDDIEFSCAGTIARWVKAGTEVVYVLCTSGDVGIAKPGMTKAEAIKIREAEQLEAARIVGVTQVIFLREPDGLVVNTLDLRKKLVREIRRFKPEVVIVSDPTIVWVNENYINHPDHRAVAAAALDAIFPAAGQPNLFEELAEEGLSAHKVRKVYVLSWDNTDTYVNITETIEQKVLALAAHTSQMAELKVDPFVYIKKRAAEIAKGKEMAYAEAYRVITLVSDEDFANQEGSGLKPGDLP